MRRANEDNDSTNTALRLPNHKTKNTNKMTKWKIKISKCPHNTTYFQIKIQNNMQQLDKEGHGNKKQKQWDRLKIKVTEAAVGYRVENIVKSRDWLGDGSKANLQKIRGKTQKPWKRKKSIMLYF